MDIINKEASGSKWKGYLSKFLIGGERKVLILLSMALVIVSGLMVYFWYQSKNITESDLTVNKTESEVKKLVAEISTFLVLPEDEEPTVATVSDTEALKGQPFFINAKKGDKVLIYSKTKKAILYDPIARKIVEVAPINLGSPASQP